MIRAFEDQVRRDRKLIDLMIPVDAVEGETGSGISCFLGERSHCPVENVDFFLKKAFVGGLHLNQSEQFRTKLG